MREKLTTFFLTLSVILWGTWFGGQLFNEAMVIPKWLSIPPDSMRAYDAIPTKGGFFFFMINPMFTLFSLLATLTGWKLSLASRKWMIATTLVGFLVSIVVIFYLAPLIHAASDHAIKGNISDKQIALDVQRWIVGNRLRIIVEFFGFLFSIVALRTWTKDNVRRERGFKTN
jgi:hypothetical protein